MVETVADTRSPAPTGGGAPGTTSTRLVHLPGLDGLRGLAVIAVIVYHGDVGILPGGFLGVDLFFVLSGFLITSLLLSEEHSSNRIGLGAFWSRRFRRLLPAALVLIVAASLASAAFAERTELAAIRSDGLASLLDVANWWFIHTGQSYADTFSAPSPFTHMWSLSIEEQFYLLWPLVVAGCLVTGVRARSRRRPVLLAVAAGGLVASTAWMWVLSVRGASVDRLYFGTDTRAATILAGVLLAIALEAHLRSRRRGPQGPASRALERPWPIVTTVAGVAGAAVLLWAVTSAHQRDTWLYRGGFTLVALASAAVIAATVLHPAVDRLLGGRALRWVGTRSYGLYLWHWLVLVVLVWTVPSFTGWPRLIVVAATTGVVAEVSFRLVERPIRTGAWRIPVPRITVPAVVAGVAAVIILSTTAQEARPDFLEARDPGEVELVQPSSTTAPPATTAAPATTGLPTTTAAPVPVGPPPSRVLLMGDSVGASLSDALEDAFGARGAAFANGAFPGCGVVRGDPADEQGRIFEHTSACGGSIPPTQVDLVADIRPDLVTVISSWEARDRVVDGVWHPYASPEADAVLLDLYRETIDRLTAGGARVALVTLPPPVDSERGPVEPGMVERHEHLNDLLAQVARDDPQRVSLVRMDDIVCPTDPCPTVVDGITLRSRDGTHYAEPVAAGYVAERLADRIMGVPAGSIG